MSNLEKFFAEAHLISYQKGMGSNMVGIKDMVLRVIQLSHDGG